MDKIIGEYNTIFGKCVVLIPKHPYKVGDQINLSDGNYRVTQIILPSTPAKNKRISLVIERID